MAKAIITFKVMPEDAGVDLEPIKSGCEKIAKEAGSIGNMLIEEQPIAFGLKAIIVKAMYEVEGGDFDAIAAKMNELDKVQTAEVAGMDLPLG
ncbi:elongation factor 1-beta [Candidatus Woesearchaeota archaeon]|nr:elongation factor 1-beta [Candidatus Woesearchaeota archaeon]